MIPRVRLYRFDQLAYEAAWRWQNERAEEVRNGEDEALALLQHPPVFTFGKRIRPEHLLVAPAELLARGASVIETDRGGDVTFHGPGQLVGYPVLNLRRRGLGPGEYVRRLEALLILTLSEFGLPGERVPGRPGVWVAGDKIASIGVRVQQGVTTHGFALNVETDLSWFDAIIPCGIAGTRVTSMRNLLGVTPGIQAVTAAVIRAFACIFDAELLPQAQSHAWNFNPRYAAGPDSLGEAIPSSAISASSALPREAAHAGAI